ncbi:MAG: FixH family protein [Acidobacteria bacterium]|nr:FixH family protein [Acidobacteriota bacterium]
MYKYLFFIIITPSILAAACGAGERTGAAGKAIKSGPAGNNLTVTVSNTEGVLKKGKQTLTVTFADASGKPVDVGAASLNFFMPAMGSMSAMNSPAPLTTTSTPGVYSAMADIEMSGEWQAQIKYEGGAGKGNATLPITAQ